MRRLSIATFTSARFGKQRGSAFTGTLPGLAPAPGEPAKPRLRREGRLRLTCQEVKVGADSWNFCLLWPLAPSKKMPLPLFGPQMVFQCRCLQIQQLGIGWLIHMDDWLSATYSNIAGGRLICPGQPCPGCLAARSREGSNVEFPTFLSFDKGKALFPVHRGDLPLVLQRRTSH